MDAHDRRAVAEAMVHLDRYEQLRPKDPFAEAWRAKLYVELHRFEALGSSTPVDRFRLTRGVWSSLKNWGSSTRRER